MKNTELVLISIFVAVESAHAFSAFNPSLFTIHHFRDQHTVQDIRTGCILASAFSLVVGAIATALLHHPAPLLMAAATAAGMSSVYMAAAVGKL